MRSSFKAILVVLLLCTILALLSLRGPETPAQAIKQRLITQTDSLLNQVSAMQQTAGMRVNSRKLQQHFKQVRLAYKKIEWATEYFDPLTARLVNGPPVPEVELGGQVVQPDGLQVIENLLFPSFKKHNNSELTDLLKRLHANIIAYKQYFQKTDLQDWQILDAAKQEVFRVEILGLNDFDDPLLHNCFAESAAALCVTASVINKYDNEIDFKPSILYLQKSDSFDRFDRATFIIRYTDRLSRSIGLLQKRMHLPDIRYNRLLNQNAGSLFEPGAFNSNAFTASPEDSATLEKIVLGKKLFFDPILSGNGKRSCASCHQPDKAFSDGLIKNLDILGNKAIARNTPTLLNAALQPAQFYDLRSPSLEDQAGDVVRNRDEMHGDMQVSVGKLWKDENYRKLFAKAYPAANRSSIDTIEVMNALAGYVRSLTVLNSRFDSYMLGRTNALSKSEVTGFNLFMGKAKCSTCHYLPLFNGALPPRYMQMEAEVIGVPKKANGKVIDPDLGLYNIQKFDFNRYAFKITTVRNAAKTAPYMHNGVFKTLEGVIDFYDKGGAEGLGIHLPNQTLPADQLHLTTTEKRQLIAFIKSLNSH